MTDFTVTAVNDSNNDFYFYMFQKSPELESAGFSSTAWLTTAYKIAKNGGVANFKWSINYGLQWSQQGEVAPGVIVGQGARATPVSTGVGESNYVKFSIANDAPRFTDLQNKGSAGSLFIDTINAVPNIPSDTFVFGLAVNDKLAWATAAQNGLLLSMTPKVKFWLTSGATIAQNEVLESNVTSNAVQFDFKDGKNNAVVTLQSNNTWSAPSYSATPLFKAEAPTALQSTPTSPSLSLLSSHNNLSVGESVWDISNGIIFSNNKSLTSQLGDPLITGTISVAAAVAVGFAYIIASGIKLSITHRRSQTEFSFSYDGQLSQNALASAFAVGQPVEFTNK